MRNRNQKLRGLRDLTTIQGLSGRMLPNSREQIVAEQARLEHERSRLEREEAMWRENLERTSERLGAVNERLALLSGALDPTPSPRPSPVRRDQGSTGDRAQDQTEWHSIVLEY